MIFEELDFQKTPLGEISLRRRQEPRLDGLMLYEVKLDEEFLMSSLFTEAEEQLARLALQSIAGDELDVVVGGLGLGYTAVAALEFPAVKTLAVIDVMQPVINWHQRELVPMGAILNADPRCRLVLADFFAAVADPAAFEAVVNLPKVDAILLDIDHSPQHWLNAGNSSFYSTTGLGRLLEKLRPGGVFGLWSNDPPDQEFVSLLESIFVRVESHLVSFANPYTDGTSSNSVYLAWT